MFNVFSPARSFLGVGGEEAGGCVSSDMKGSGFFVCFVFPFLCVSVFVFVCLLGWGGWVGGGYN